MPEFSVLIGGKAGFGIDKSGSIIGRLLNQQGWRIYIYRDYPSVIRGGHTFSIIRASDERIACHSDSADFILALNQDTFNIHRERLNDASVLIYDADSVNPQGLPQQTKSISLPIAKIIKEESAPDIMRNTCIIGAFCKAAGLKWEALDSVFRKEMARDLDLNLKVSRRGFDAAEKVFALAPPAQSGLPMLTGNQAISLGLIKAGLKAYIAYPMTPSSPILHYLAEISADFGLKVIHPESEIAVMLMALGFAYTGEKVAVGTSGGGFCLMTEGLSLSGMSELPVVIVLGQRPGPSTGLPTYSSQTELHFALHSGQGEFTRFVVAPSDAEEAYYWSQVALNFSWKYQIPSIILSDKNMGEGLYNFDNSASLELKEEIPPLWDGVAPYRRYLDTTSGVSPLAFAPRKDAIIKVNSYEHDESGITTEDPKETVRMQDKRLRKEKYLLEGLNIYETVKSSGDKGSSIALLCWGSNKGVCLEVAQKLRIRVIQPIVFAPFPEQRLRGALSGVKKIICVESNATGQLANLLKAKGIEVQEKILKYDGRPFSLEELEAVVRKLLA